MPVWFDERKDDEIFEHDLGTPMSKTAGYIDANSRLSLDMLLLSLSLSEPALPPTRRGALTRLRSAPTAWRIDKTGESSSPPHRGKNFELDPSFSLSCVSLTKCL